MWLGKGLRSEGEWYVCVCSGGGGEKRFSEGGGMCVCMLMKVFDLAREWMEC